MDYICAAPYAASNSRNDWEQNTMIFLLLTIATSAMISLFMRLSTDKVSNNYGMLAAGYMVSTALAALHTDFSGFAQSGMGTAVAMGFVNGALYLMGLVLMQRNIRKSGVVLTSTFSRLGLVACIILSMLLFRESPTALQVAGMVLAVGAIVLSSGKMDASKFQPQLLLSLLNMGMIDTWVKAFDAWGNNALSDQFLLLTFLTAALLCLGLMQYKKQRIGPWELLFGAAIAIPNYYNSRCLLLALQDIPGIILYPTYSVATLLTITVMGVCVFKERLSRRQWVAMGVILVALALLNL